MAADAENTTPSQVSATPFKLDDGATREAQTTTTTSTQVFRGVLFGAFVGVCMGGLTGAAVCWTVETNDFLPHVAAIVAGVGLVLGAIVGGLERWWRGALARPDLATFIGGGFGLVVALLVFCGGFGSSSNKLSIFVSVGLAFVFPMIGLLVGAFFDRSFEAASNGNRRDGLVFGVLGAAASVGVLWLMIAQPSGDLSAEIKRPVNGMIHTKWKTDPAMKDAIVRNLVVTRKSDRFYVGSFDAEVGGRTTPYHLDVELRGSTIVAEWRPADD